MRGLYLSNNTIFDPPKFLLDTTFKIEKLPETSFIWKNTFCED